jgi:hypothetical protein
MPVKLEKNQTSISAEFYAAGELSRLGYNVTVTFGNTKSIDLLIQKEHQTFQVQVKGIQSDDSICWNVDKAKVRNSIYFVLINLHVDIPTSKPEFFVLTGQEVLDLFKDTSNPKRSYLDYGTLRRMEHYQNRWYIFGEPDAIIETPTHD